jgi:two-component system, cell cycle sensor histidine kinase and response regulator CckA
VHPSVSNESIRVLLIEDDEDDHILTRSLLSEIQDRQFQMDWIRTWEEGLHAVLRNAHDVCLVDYRLGAQTGIDLLRAALERGCQAPIILLTGQRDQAIDLEAMKAGAADYLIKGRLDASLLERSIRYALERKRGAARAAAEQARLAAFGAEVGLAVTRRDALEAILDRCAKAMVRYLQGDWACVWGFDLNERLFRLHASAGPAGPIVPWPRDWPQELGRPDQLNAGQTILVSQFSRQAPTVLQEWARREGIYAFAGYPLVLEDRLVGLMGLFARRHLSEAILQEMGSVANGIALCIERKRSEEALESSQVQYRSVVENIKEVIFQTDQYGRWTFLNPAWKDVTGFAVKETLGTHFADYIHPDDRERHRDALEQVIQWKRSYARDETRYLAKDGSYRWIEVYAQPTLGSNGVAGASGTLSDITERKRSEAEIQKLAAFPRYNPDPVMELASDGTVTYLNNAAREMARVLEVSENENILPPQAAHIARECLRLGHSKLSHEVKINGRTLSWSFFPIVASQVVHCYGADVTERLNLEDQLRHAQRLESVGRLAAGVAHDFNNILTIIQGHTDRLLLQCDGDDQLTDPLRLVSGAAKRASALTAQLLAFSRKQVMQPRLLDLNAVLNNLGKMLHRLLGDDITLELRQAPDLPTLEADCGMLEQVIMNLAVNARDAMPKGGQLLIATEATDITAAYLQQCPEARVGRHVCLSVTDTGCGMAKETLDRIFEPFFTTKPVGKGTGLGLATVYGIVKQHQGWIEVESQVNAGTIFKVFLLASSKTLEVSADPAHTQHRVRGGSETILLVEDEPVLRELARVILQDYDYRVLEACSGVEAIRVWEEHEGQVDLLLTDMVMPEGMTGRELADELKSRKPDLKVIYTSGYSADVMGQDSPLRDTMFLQKPYAPPLLAQTVRECLDLAPKA